MINNKKNNFNPIPYFIICSITAICLDFLLTDAILANHIYQDFKIFDIVFIKNTGAAFSFFENYTLPLIIFSVITLCFILYELFKDIHKYSLMTYFFSSILSSGIICNMYERITLGYVRDFIRIKYLNLPIFNISDILINFAVLAIIFLVITKRYRKND